MQDCLLITVFQNIDELIHVKEYERRYKIGLKRFCFKLKVYVDKNLVS